MWDSAKAKNAKKVDTMQLYDGMQSMKKNVKAYERFLRKPYEMTIGKVEVIEDGAPEED